MLRKDVLRKKFYEAASSALLPDSLLSDSLLLADSSFITMFTMSSFTWSISALAGLPGGVNSALTPCNLQHSRNGNQS